jgi:hypothetical protein
MLVENFWFKIVERKPKGNDSGKYFYFSDSLSVGVKRTKNSAGELTPWKG